MNTSAEDVAVACDVRSRPCLYACRSDFRSDGVLRAPREASEGGAWVLVDRRLYAAVRVRAARWVDAHLHEGLSGEHLVDPTFIGRRGHECETRTYLAVAKLGLQSARLDRREEDPIGRMARDASRTHGVVHARQGTVLGVAAGF